MKLLIIILIAFIVNVAVVIYISDCNIHEMELRNKKSMEQFRKETAKYLKDE